jgi:hypothetical protein
MPCGLPGWGGVRASSVESGLRGRTVQAPEGSSEATRSSHGLIFSRIVSRTRRSCCSESCTQATVGHDDQASSRVAAATAASA